MGGGFCMICSGFEQMDDVDETSINVNPLCVYEGVGRGEKRRLID